MSTTVSHPPVDVDPGPVCPVPVPHAGSHHRWDELTFLHWSYEPGVVQRLLPPDLTVETFGGRAWVGLIPFRMSITAGDVPVLGRQGAVAPIPPWIGRFAETNVRTYVRGPDGGTGVWFLSLDAARLAAVVAARARFAMPYHWAAMAVSSDVSPAGRLVVDYRSRRRWPGPAASSHVTVEVGERLAPGQVGARDHWLTARWSLYRRPGGAVRSMAAEHEPWPLHAARVLRLDDTLLTAAGLPAPADDPLVLWSPGVAVRVGPRGRN
jgi:uncharacterized protein YqjF (DUF2071 family)